MNLILLDMRTSLIAIGFGTGKQLIFGDLSHCCGPQGWSCCGRWNERVTILVEAGPVTAPSYRELLDRSRGEEDKRRAAETRDLVVGKKTRGRRKGDSGWMWVD